MHDVLTEPSDTVEQLHAMDDAQRFLARLMVMPLADWYLSATTATAPDLAMAMHALDEAVRTSDMLFAAWLVRDHVATALHRFGSPAGRHICPAQHAHAVRAATERAAQALLVRSSLNAKEFRLLYGGFAQTLPVDSRRGAS